MRPAGLSEYEKTIKNPKIIYDIKTSLNEFVPEDLLDVLRINTVAYNNFMNFPPSSRKLYIFWLNDAKRAETRQCRIEKIVDRAEKNLRAGMM